MLMPADGTTLPVTNKRELGTSR